MGFCRMKCAFLFLIVISLGAPGVWAADGPDYEIDAVIDVSAKTITARQKVTFVNKTSKATDALYFHVYPNRMYTKKEKAFLLRYAGYFKVDPYPDGFPKDVFHVQGVKERDREVAFSIEGEDKTILKVVLANSLEPGEAATVEMEFTLKIPHAYGRFGWNEKIIALSRWYPILSVYGENGWSNYPFYPFHRPFFSEAANYHVRLTVPSDQNVIHTGDQVKEENAGATKMLEFETPIPVREFSLAMSPEYKYVEGKFESTTIRSYYLPGHEERAEEAVNNAVTLMEYYTPKFGHYPYRNFSIAPVYLGYGGEQMSNMVFIDTRVFELPKILYRYFDFLIAHETGHQWFYNILGIDSFKEIWMEEGFNSYFLQDYLEHKYGKNAEILDTSRWPKWLKIFVPHLSFRTTAGIHYKLLARQGMDHPIIDKLSGYAEPSSIFSLAYGKGSMVVRMLKGIMGEEAFDRAFARLFKEYSYRNVSLSDFKRICNEEHGGDISWFFDQWLHSDKHYDLEVLPKGKDIVIENRGGIKMPTDVVVKHRDGSEERFNTTDGISIPKKSVQSISIDPENKWLDLDKTNNYWPHRARFFAVPLYLPLHDLPIFWPEDSYNVIVGPEIDQGIGVKASIQQPYDQILYAASDYDLNEKWQTSRIGYEKDNLFDSMTAFGIEMKNRTDFDDGDEDLVTAKAFIRRELWPSAYGLTDINDHVTLYLIRNQSLNRTKIFGGSEDIRNASYLKNDEAIVGTAFHLGNARPHPDPREGYTLDTMVENSGHFWGATQQFTRSMVDYRFFQPVTAQSKIGIRTKYGWGSVDDKNLFELGGINGLRGFDRKTVRGANALMGSVEYRFPLINGLNWTFFDHLIGLHKISGVAFFDAGQSWYGSFKDTDLRRDAGLGLRLHMAVGSYLEEAILRIDAAQAINDDEDDVHFWIGLNHAF